MCGANLGPADHSSGVIHLSCIHQAPAPSEPNSDLVVLILPILSCTGVLSVAFSRPLMAPRFSQMARCACLTFQDRWHLV